MTVSTVRELAARTPTTRNRVVDFARAASITVVVFGHWMMASAVATEGGIDDHGILAAAPWTQWLTWVLQVMPIFFLVGGYSNALSWRSTAARGGGYSAWLGGRIRRLMTPVVPLLVFWVLAVWTLTLFNLPEDQVRAGSQIALTPTWFLAAYALVVAVAPLTLKAWDRWGWWTVAAGAALAGVVDAVSIAAAQPLLGYPNYLIVWATVHSLGYAWLDGRLAGLGRRSLLAGAGLVGLAAAVWFGPYPVSMIGLDSNAVNNSAPTRITMLFLGCVQAGVLLSAERPLARWLRGRGAWTVTVFINTRIMSLYLWHLSALVVVVGAALALGGIGLHAEPMTASWWALRPLWLAAFVVVTALAVTAFGRFENPVRDTRPRPPLWVPLTATALCCGGVAVMAEQGLVAAGGWIWPLLPIAGVALVSAGRARPA